MKLEIDVSLHTHSPVTCSNPCAFQYPTLLPFDSPILGRSRLIQKWPLFTSVRFTYASHFKYFNVKRSTDLLLVGVKEKQNKAEDYQNIGGLCSYHYHRKHFRV